MQNVNAHLAPTVYRIFPARVHICKPMDTDTQASACSVWSLSPVAHNRVTLQTLENASPGGSDLGISLKPSFLGGNNLLWFSQT